MVVAIDLTTIATVENSGGYAHFLNREFELGIEEAELARASTFRDFASLPQTRRFFARAQSDPALSQQIEEIIDGVDPLHPLMLQALLPSAGAVAGVQSLADDQTIIYVTRRPRSCEDITRAWLHRSGFPYAQQLFFCLSDAEKWLHAAREAEADEAIVLIDGQVTAMITAYRQFCLHVPDQARWSRERVSLLAFGRAQESPRIATPFPVHPFPSWNALPTIRATASI